jgi:putative ubiquitin-RnfH superfamily antitoxin RatB of RatAB toxin-antitoxin module
MAEEHRDGRIEVVVAFSPAPRCVERAQVSLPSGATVRDALEASGMLPRHPDMGSSGQKVGVWGKLKPLETVLRDRDRVEVYRPLHVDPKEARRQRYRSQPKKAKTAR